MWLISDHLEQLETLRMTVIEPIHPTEEELVVDNEATEVDQEAEDREVQGQGVDHLFLKKGETN